MTPELVAHSVVVTNFREIFNALAALAWLIFDQAGSNKCLSGIRLSPGTQYLTILPRRGAQAQARRPSGRLAPRRTPGSFAN